jgi:hypothetical protein
MKTVLALVVSLGWVGCEANESPSLDREPQRLGVEYLLAVSPEGMDSGVLLNSRVADRLACADDPDLPDEELRAAALTGIPYLKPMLGQEMI